MQERVYRTAVRDTSDLKQPPRANISQNIMDDVNGEGGYMHARKRIERHHIENLLN